jgi:hypothetical protein
MTERLHTHLISGGHRGTESEFGRCAARWGIPHTTLSFEGHALEYDSNVEVLDERDLEQGTVSMSIVFERLGRRFHRGHGVRRVIQSMFHLVVRGQHLLAVGWIQPDQTVKGGTGWGVELARLFNREVHAFDQERERWFRWDGSAWVEEEPVIGDQAFSATGTRNLTEGGRRAIHDLFRRSFGEPVQGA